MELDPEEMEVFLEKQIREEADLERRGSNTNSNNGQWVGWEEGKTELTIFPR